ncbi:MAG: phage integrase SAM-like domain-containing protein, partial [Muribaculaceae bacterium]|nr:phage integrase SAM-like domain-containing protein [Muribaculaceae bacterium]
MASIKVKFRPSTVADREGTIYYQIIHERKVRQFISNYKIFPAEWNESRSMVATSYKSERKSFILSIRERIRWDLERLTRIDRRLDANGLTYTADDVIDEFNRYAHEYSLFNFMENIIAKLKKNGKVRTSETYKSTLNSFKKFRHDEDIMLDCINSEIMEAYEAWHKERGVAPNTISFYTRILRAVYNRAVEDEIIENRNPFRHVYTGIDKTVKRALPLSFI